MTYFPNLISRKPTFDLLSAYFDFFGVRQKGLLKIGVWRYFGPFSRLCRAVGALWPGGPGDFFDTFGLTMTLTLAMQDRILKVRASLPWFGFVPGGRVHRGMAIESFEIGYPSKLIPQEFLPACIGFVPEGVKVRSVILAVRTVIPVA